MIFSQQVNINNMVINQELMRICELHPGCEGCDLQNKDMNIQGVMVRCETGRAKRGQ